ncbi:MAG: PAS domain S-box protein [Longimicrobiales bacterium]|nr:PAS domain S-box protein [Longimicrobiales bacterium]
MFSPREIRILVVEDNPGDADLIEAYLEPHSHVQARLLRAETLGSALRQVRDPGADVVLLDLTLPDSEGIVTLERLREAAPNVPVILLTGRHDDELVWAAIQRGADDYLPKNELSQDLLARSVRYALDRTDTARILRQREEWFRSLVENVTDLVVTVDGSGTVSYVSPAQEDILGHDADEVRGTSVLELVHPDDRAEASEGLRRAIEEGGTVEFQLRVAAADGAWRFVAGDARNLLHVPAVQGVVITGRDITEAVEREALLKRQAAELGERVKEQQSLRQVLSVLHQGAGSLETALQTVVEVIPPGFQHPASTEARLRIGADEWRTPGYRRTEWRLDRRIDSDHDSDAVLEVVRTGLGEEESRAFIPEERQLVDAIAEAVSDALRRAHAHAELGRREAYFRSITEHSTDVLFILGEDLTPRYVSPSAEEVLGLGPEAVELGTEAAYEFVHPEDREALYALLAELGRHPGEVRRSEARARIHGEWGTLEFAARNLLEDPDIRGVVVNARDITERRRSEERYRTLFETMGQGVVYQDRSGAIISANPAAERILGLSLEQMQGRTSTHPEWRALRPDGSPFPGEEHPAMVALRTGEPVSDTLMGVYHPGEGRTRWIRVDARPQFRPGETAPDQVYTTFADVTDRVVNERELRRKDAILEAVSVAAERFLVGGSLDAVTDEVLGALGRATEVDGVGLWELEPVEEGGLQATLWFEWRRRPEDPVGVTSETRVMRSGSGWLAELEAGRVAHGVVSDLPDGERAALEEADIRMLALVPVRVRGQLWGLLRFAHASRETRWSPLEIDALRAAGAILGAAIQRRQDEEKLREQDQELLRAQKMEAIGRLAGGIAHDFNNLLTAIGGNATFAAEQLGDRVDLAGEVEEIRQSVERGGRLTKQLLAFSRQQVVEEKVLDPGQVAQGIEPMLTRLIGEHIRLETRLADDRHPVLMDPSQLEQVFMNLVLNARDALEGGGAVRITVDGVSAAEISEFTLPTGSSAESYTRIRVADTGAGMSPETLERVFEPFFTTKGPEKGTGLGLSTVYGIVQGAGGHIEVMSAPGDGTTVTILLPSVEVADAADAGPVREPGGVGGTAAGVVLVVEDEPSVRTVAVRSLERHGFTVLEAGDGREALEQFDNGRHASIDVLLSDVVMPEIGGLELARRLRAICPELKVILTSGYTQDELVQQGVDDRELAFLPKPYTPGELVGKVAAVLGARA